MANTARLSARNMSTTLVLPRTLRAEVQDYSEKTGARMGEIMRRALVAYLAAQKPSASDCKTGA